MAKGYWIAHIDVTDAEKYPDYLAAARIAFDKYGAVFVVRGGRMQAAEGSARSRHVVIEFPTYEQALECYHSSDYQHAAKLRQAYATSELIIVEGVP